MVGYRNTYRYLLGKPEGKCPFRIPSNRWEGVKLNLKKVLWEGVGWINLVSG
jgi:hypothetical protein